MCISQTMLQYFSSVVVVESSEYELIGQKENEEGKTTEASKNDDVPFLEVLAGKKRKPTGIQQLEKSVLEERTKRQSSK